ncbi:DUF6732 family protein [Roseibium sp.]|uniref:DUF6732 family protein n=1 Tax=Roseibium sp. TaxID=1936156 RepID=UPI003265700F
MTHRTVFAGLAAAVLPTSAFAHGGHLGDLAGHSHWVGVAALAGAALIAGVIALKGRKRAQEDDSAEQDAEDADTAGNAAQ